MTTMEVYEVDCERCLKARICVSVETGFAGESEPLCGDCVSAERAQGDERLDQAQAEIQRLKAAIDIVQVELDKGAQYFVRRSKERSTSKEEALLQSLFSEPYMAVVKAQAALAEEGADGS